MTFLCDQDQVIMILLISSLSHEVLPFVVDISHLVTFGLLESSLSVTSQARVPYVTSKQQTRQPLSYPYITQKPYVIR